MEPPTVRDGGVSCEHAHVERHYYSARCARLEAETGASCALCKLAVGRECPYRDEWEGMTWER